MKRQVIVLALVAALVMGVTAYAHHSFTSTYFDDRDVTIEGKIVAFQFRNPHSFVTVEDKDGVRWGVEWGGAGQLGAQGINRFSLRAGDEVIITGRLGRSWETDHRALMRTLHRKSDGFGWGTREGEVVD